MNISKHEQRVLHALAQGGRIIHRRCAQTGKITQVDCFNRDGWRLDDCTRGVFDRLRRRRLIASHGGQPYRISRLGLDAVASVLPRSSIRIPIVEVVPISSPRNNVIGIMSS